VDIKIKSEEEWLALRDAYIGGSEVAGLFVSWRYPDRSVVTLHAYEEPDPAAVCLGSCSPYTTPSRLYLAKSGQLMPEDFGANERVQAGSYLEPALAQWAMSKWGGWKLRKVRRYSEHPEVRGWGCSVDYEVHGPGMEPVEFKNIDFAVAKSKWVIEDEEIIAAPLHIQLQLQHYIAARGAKRGWIVACIGGNKLVRGCFEAHAPTAERIRDAITAFWIGIDAKMAPPIAVDFEAMAEAYAFGDQKAKPVDLTDDVDLMILARRYVRWKRHEKFIQAAISNMKGRIAARVGEAPRAFGMGFKVTWPVIHIDEKMVPAKIQPPRDYRGAFTVTLKEED
jgi:predicted phage-related endonuclease